MTAARLGFALPALIATCAARGASDGTQCERKYSDEAVRRLLVTQKFEAADALVQVNWKDCIYYIVAWPRPITPDTRQIYTMGVDGRIKRQQPL